MLAVCDADGHVAVAVDTESARHSVVEKVLLRRCDERYCEDGCVSECFFGGEDLID